MSKIRSPQEKKRLSLLHDRRNVYGQSPHAARRLIPRHKAARSQAERRVATQTLAQVLGQSDKDSVDAIDGKVQSRSRLKRLAGFKKIPDASLGKVIEQN